MAMSSQMCRDVCQVDLGMSGNRSRVEIPNQWCRCVFAAWISEKHTGGRDLVWSKVGEWSTSERMLRACMKSRDSNWLRMVASQLLILEGEGVLSCGRRRSSIDWRQKSVQIVISDKELLAKVRAVMNEQRNKVFGSKHIEWKISTQNWRNTVFTGFYCALGIVVLSLFLSFYVSIK